MKYCIAFKRSDHFGIEEYDGGNTLKEARKEAKYFCEHLPKHVRVRICTVDHSSERLQTVEVVQEGDWRR